MTFDEWLTKHGPLLAALGATPDERRQMEVAWNAAIRNEREACAKLAESFVWFEHENCSPDESNEVIAQLIRQRSK